MYTSDRNFAIFGKLPDRRWSFVYRWNRIFHLQEYSNYITQKTFVYSVSIKIMNAYNRIISEFGIQSSWPRESHKLFNIDIHKIDFLSAWLCFFLARICQALRRASCKRRNASAQI